MTDPHSFEGLRHQSIPTHGVRLHAVSAGDPAMQTVVLLHGWPQTWWEWRHVMPALSQRFHVVALDLRGFGDSDRPAPESGYDVATLAADIAGVLDHLAVARAHVVGHDLGGHVAYAVARLHPQRVDKLALADTPLPLYGLEVPGWAQVEKRLWHQQFHRVPYLPEALIAGRERLYLSWFFSMHAWNRSAIGPADVDEYVRAYSAPGGLSAGFAFSRTTERSAEQVKAASTGPLSRAVALHGRRGLDRRQLRASTAATRPRRAQRRRAGLRPLDAGGEPPVRQPPVARLLRRGATRWLMPPNSPRQSIDRWSPRR